MEVNVAALETYGAGDLFKGTVEMGLDVQRILEINVPDGEEAREKTQMEGMT